MRMPCFHENRTNKVSRWYILVTMRQWNDKYKVSWVIHGKYDLFNSDCFFFAKVSLASFKYDQLVHISVKDFSLQPLNFNKIRQEESSFSPV